MALTIGLLFALLSMTTAMAQVERGGNRIYGIRRDRPALHKYGRAAVFTALLAVPVGLGFLLLVAGNAFGDAMVREYGWSDGDAALVAGAALAGRAGHAGARDRGALRPRAPAAAAGAVVAGPRLVDRGAAEHGGRGRVRRRTSA